MSHILSKYVVANVWWVATNASFTSVNLPFAFGHVFALGPLDPHIVPHIVKICGGKCVVGSHQRFVYFL